MKRRENRLEVLASLVKSCQKILIQDFLTNPRIMTSNSCTICLQDCSEFSELDLSKEIDMLSLTKSISVASGKTANRYHVVCLARSLKNQSTPIDPVNRVPLKPEIVGPMHIVMNLLEIPYPTALERRIASESEILVPD